MPKYIVSGIVTVSIYTEVIAETEEEALKLAGDQPMMSFCNQCSRGTPEDEWVTAGELDGEPQELRAEEEE